LGVAPALDGVGVGGHWLSALHDEWRFALEAPAALQAA
jgi:hypothetical protein